MAAPLSRYPRSSRSVVGRPCRRDRACRQHGRSRLVAKPYIDIDVVLKPPTHMEDGRVRMQAAGLEPRGSRHGDGVFAFMLRDPLPGLRVYLCPPNSLTHQNRLRFRDILRQNPSLANHYATLKMALAEKYKDDGDTYTRAKSDFIRETLNTDTSPASAP
ncbi:GrpB family protein [Agrobacterium tumefaciens]|nr:GrpB family protein [Agrobacterium tumefaciens]